MTQSIPVTYYFNNIPILYTGDMSYVMPAIGDEIEIKGEQYIVDQKQMFGLLTGERKCFINLKLKENV